MDLKINLQISSDSNNSKINRINNAHLEILTMSLYIT